MEPEWDQRTGMGRQQAEGESGGRETEGIGCEWEVLVLSNRRTFQHESRSRKVFAKKTELSSFKVQGEGW